MKTDQYPKQEVPLETGSEDYPIFIPSIAVMISCADAQGRPNIIPIVAWTVVARYPFTVAIGLCNGNYSKSYFPRHSWKVIQETREFVLNIPHEGLKEAISLSGSVSGADPSVDKFKLCGLTPGPAKTVKAPIILECPINLECKVTEIVRAGSHDVFFAKVTAIQSDPVLSQEIKDDVMVLEVLKPNPITMELEKHTLFWKTLPEFIKNISA